MARPGGNLAELKRKVLNEDRWAKWSSSSLASQAHSDCQGLSSQMVFASDQQAFLRDLCTRFLRAPGTCRIHISSLLVGTCSQMQSSGGDIRMCCALLLPASNEWAFQQP